MKFVHLFLQNLVLVTDIKWLHEQCILSYFFYNFHNYTFQCQFFVVTLLSKIAKIHTSLCNTDNFVFCKRLKNIRSESILENALIAMEFFYPSFSWSFSLITNIYILTNEASFLSFKCWMDDLPQTVSREPPGYNKLVNGTFLPKHTSEQTACCCPCREHPHEQSILFLYSLMLPSCPSCP